MKLGKFFVLLFLFPVCLQPYTSLLKAQVAITALPFLEINHDARSMGMAGATVALKNSRAGMHLNPATIGKKNTIEFSTQLNISDPNKLFGTSWLRSWTSRLSLYTPQFIMGFDKWSFGYQYTYLDFGPQAYFPGPDVNPGDFYVFESYERAHTFSAAYHFNDHISVGLGMNAVKSNLGTGTIVSEQQIIAPSNITWDFGFYADRDFRYDFLNIKPSFGWSLTDFGYPISYTEGGGEDPMPIIMRAGLGLELDFINSTDNRKVFQIAGYLSRDKIMARWNDDGTPMGPFEVLFRSWDSYYRYHNGTPYVKVSLEDQIRNQQGFEITMLEMFSFRMGSYYEHPENGDRQYDTIGFGLHIKNITLDYAEMDVYDRESPLANTYFVQLSVNINLD